MLTTTLLAALAATVSASAAEGSVSASDRNVPSRVAATASASVRIQGGFRLTRASAATAVPGAQTVTREINDARGVARTAGLVEFE